MNMDDPGGVFIMRLLAATIVYGLARFGAVRLALRVVVKMNASQPLVGNLKRNLIKLFGFLYLVVVFNLALRVPLLGDLARPVLDYSLIDVEALSLSLFSVLRGIAVFYISLLIMKVIRTSIRMYLQYRSESTDIESTVDILVYNTALVFIILTTLSVMGISWKLLLPVAGALGIGIGFGIQDIANNFISGFVILMGKTIKRGDWITLGDNFGQIEEIGIRTSTLRTVDNIDIIIPNSQLISNQLINWSYTDNIVRIHVPVGVTYGSDVHLVREILLDVARRSPHVLDAPEPEARFASFGDSSLNFELLVWLNIKVVKIPFLKSTLNYLIWEAFRERGVQIPFPQRDVWFRNTLRIESGPESE